MPHLHDLLDVVLGVLLTIGCALSVPVYWWVFVCPIIQLWRRHRAGKLVARSLTSDCD